MFLDSHPSNFPLFIWDSIWDSLARGWFIVVAPTDPSCEWDTPFELRQQMLKEGVKAERFGDEGLLQCKGRRKSRHFLSLLQRSRCLHHLGIYKDSSTSKGFLAEISLAYLTKDYAQIYVARSLYGSYSKVKTAQWVSQHRILLMWWLLRAFWSIPQPWLKVRPYVNPSAIIHASAVLCLVCKALATGAVLDPFCFSCIASIKVRAKCQATNGLASPKH